MTNFLNYQPNFLLVRPIFSPEEKDRLRRLADEYPLRRLLENPRAFQESSIEYTFVSSKIEGNSYTLKDTADLLKYGFTTGSKPFNDALMIKNINQAFEEICTRKHTFYPVLSKPFLCGVHQTVCHDLMSRERCGKVREEPVSIQGSCYLPLAGAPLLEGELDNLLKYASSIENVFERAVYVHLNLAYLQYFLDGNKRTARLMQTAVLTEAGCTPLLLKDNDIIEYQHSVVDYYETGRYNAYANLFLRGYQNTIDVLLGRSPAQLEAQKRAEELIRMRR